MSARPTTPQALDDPAPPAGLRPPTATRRTDARTVVLSGHDGPHVWRFRFSPDPASAPDDIADPALDDASWPRIPVPASFGMPALDDAIGGPHGRPAYTNHLFPFPVDPPFPPDANPIGDYRLRFALEDPPARATLRFDGVEGAGTVWLNGVLLGSTRGSRLPSEFDVGDLLAADNVLAVRVHTFSAASYVEDQDEWWAPGIIRAVTLVERPARGIRDVHVRADWGRDGATLRVDVVREGSADGVQNSTDRSPEVADSPPERRSGGESVEFRAGDAPLIELVETGQLIPSGETVRVPGVAPWSAEQPTLWTLRVTSPVEVVELRIGFRTVDIRDGVLRVNGAPVRFRGVNRHEHHPRFGRHVPADVVRAELLLMKRHNIQAIRTSHYPPDPLLLDLADELGFWVIDEADVETHGFADVGWRGNPTDDAVWTDAFVDRVTRMVARDRNHPSIVMWSLGNEAGEGRNVAAMADAVRALDPTRPLHYEGDQSSAHVDVWSGMYTHPERLELIGRRAEPPLADPTLDERRRAMPFVLCEYAHAMGTGPGGLAEYQRILDARPRLAGAFVWEWLEHGIEAVRDGIRTTGYGGDFGERTHDGDFVIDGLVSADRVPRPQLADLAAVFAPVALEFDGDAVVARSRRDHLDTRDLALRWRIARGAEPDATAGELSLAPLAPRDTGRATLPPRALQLAPGETLEVFVAQRDATAWAEAGYVVARIARSSAALPAPLPVTALGLDALDLDPRTGAVRRLGSVPVEDWRLELWRAPTSNDREPADDRPELPAAAARWAAQGLDRLTSRLVSIDRTPDAVAVRTRIGAAGVDTGVDVTWRWTAADDGLRLALDVEPFGPRDVEWARVGVSFALRPGIDDVQWHGRGPGPAYPDTGAAAVPGTYRASVAELAERTVRPQEAGSRADVRRARLRRDDEPVVEIDALPPVALTVRPWSTERLATATHDHELVADGATHVVLDLAQDGVGTAACGPDILEPYRLTARRVTGTLVFRVP
ncbi:MAG: glycoside hydrolase [Microbacterium sp.]|nr:glycoside hydrolase [Microbacterium sp.]